MRVKNESTEDPRGFSKGTAQKILDQIPESARMKPSMASLWRAEMAHGGNGTWL
jgi:hypothetical protein